MNLELKSKEDLIEEIQNLQKALDDYKLSHEQEIIKVKARRKVVEQALVESESRYRQLVEVLPNAIIVHRAGKIIFANKATSDLIGAKYPQELVGTNIITYLPKDYWDTYSRSLYKVLVEDKTDRWTEFKISKTDGTLLDVEASSAAIKYMGKPAVLAVIRDITERKKLEQEILRTCKLESLGVLAGGIAHDFNNILTIIMGNISLAKLTTNDDTILIDRLEEIEQAAFQAKELTQQLLTFSKGGQPIKKAIATKELIIQITKLTLSGSHVQYQLDIAGNLSPINADEGQLGQTLNNILLNACQAMPDGGNIEVKAKNITIKADRKKKGVTLKAGDYVQISIKDQGVGMSPEIISKIFDPYFTTKKTGNGLGLATAYSIIKKHEGQLAVESEVGKGTIFYIFLPASNDVILKNYKDSQKLVKGKGHILIMDDDEAVRLVAGNMLEQLGFEVSYAEDGRQAINLYTTTLEKGNPFTAVILDLTVRGGMGAKETMKQLLEIDPQVQALVSSGYANDILLADYRKYGFVGVVSKPYEIQELSKIMQEIIQEYSVV